MAFQDIADARIEFQRPLTSSLMTALNNNQRGVAWQSLSGTGMTGNGGLGGTWETVITWQVYLPGAFIGPSGVHFSFSVLRTVTGVGGSGDGDYRLKVGTDTGAESNLDYSASPDTYTMTIDATDVTADTVTDVEFQVRSNLGGAIVITWTDSAGGGSGASFVRQVI